MYRISNFHILPQIFFMLLANLFIKLRSYMVHTSVLMIDCLQMIIILAKLCLNNEFLLWIVYSKLAPFVLL